MRNKFIVAGIIVLCLVGLYIFGFNSSKDQKVHPQKGAIVESIYGLGTVFSDEVFSVKVGTPLTIKKIYIKEGDAVKQGDPLVLADDILFKSMIAGTVTAINFKQGELVNPQMALLTVTNLKPLYLEVSLEQQSILRVKKGQEVQISFESLRSEKLTGLVSQVYPRDKQFIVRVELSDWPSGVLPGMTADLAIKVGVKNESLLIPVNSIRAGLLTRVRDGRHEKISVKIGIVNENWAEVLSGDLTENDFVLIRGK